MTKRLLIIGVMRSGTTLVNRDICESIFKIPSKSEITPLVDSIQLAARWRENYETHRYQQWLKSGELSDKIIDVTLDYLMPDDLSHAWQVGKEPNLVKYPDDVLALALRKELHILLLVREPLDVISSALAVQKTQSYGHTKRLYIDEVFRQYLGLLNFIDRSNSMESVFLLKYEDYVSDPDNCLKKIGNWLDVPFEKNEFNNIQIQVDYRDPYASKLLERSPSTESIGVYKSRLSVIERHYLANVYSGVREKLGYGSLNTSSVVRFLGRVKFNLIR